MNPLLQAALVSIVRHFISLGAGILVARGIWTSADADQYVVAAAAFLVSVGWSQVATYVTSRWKASAVAVTNKLTGPNAEDITIADIDAVIKKGDAAPASTRSDVVPVMTGTGNGIADIKSLVGLFLLVAAVGSSACAAGKVLVAPAPTDDQVLSVQRLRDDILANTAMTIDLADDTGELASALPIPVAAKNAINCPIAKTFGVTNPSATVLAVCGAVPTHEASPFRVALRTLRQVTDCPGLGSTSKVIAELLEPVFQALEANANASLAFAGSALRASLRLVTLVNSGGVQCR